MVGYEIGSPVRPRHTPRARGGPAAAWGAHAAVFGSVARGETGAESDIDVLVDLDENQPMGIFEYARMKLYINQLFEGSSDVVNRRTLKPLLRTSILRDAIHAF